MSNNQILKLRRSAVPGKVPSTSSLDFGELALNTHDGYVFIKKSGSNGEEIVVVGAGSSGSFSGSFFGTSSWARNSLTASFAPLYLPLTGGTINGNLIINGTASISYLTVLYETASVIYSSGSNQFGDAADDIQTLYGTIIVPTGSLTVSGSITSTRGFSGSLNGTSSWASSSISSSYSLSSSFASSGRGVFSGSISGSFFGNGAGLTNISASSVVGLNLSSIGSGSVTASTDPAYGFRVNSNSQFTGSVLVTGSLGVIGPVNISGSSGSVLSANVDTITYTGSIYQTGSYLLTGVLSVIGGITGSLFGTSSYSFTASFIDGGFY